ncbi:MAG TPA: DUF4276 family protein [Candidatus Limnocylindria bacterium]|jgi:hypothetical protein|nr:DUF4276 family protein [Candidatus Limnocylindria bacterium]
MGSVRIASIVEGHGEVLAVPLLIRRFASSAGFSGQIDAPPPFRTPKSKLLQSGELERLVDAAANKAGKTGGIFILIDSDKDCPAKLGPELLRRARHSRNDIPIALVLAHQEFESWFLGSVQSLLEVRDFRPTLKNHPQPETISGCKEWLTTTLSKGRKYSELLDQPALTQAFDFEMAKANCPSFEKCHRELMSLINQLVDSASGQ